MVKFDQFKKDLFKIIEDGIKQGVKAHDIAEVLMQYLEIRKKDAYIMIICVGTQLNMNSNPCMSWEEAFNAYTGL